jgi:hypothetical protein
VSYTGLKKIKDWGCLEDEEGKNWFKKKEGMGMGIYSICPF